MPRNTDQLSELMKMVKTQQKQLRLLSGMLTAENQDAQPVLATAYRKVFEAKAALDELAEAIERGNVESFLQRFSGER